MNIRRACCESPVIGPCYPIVNHCAEHLELLALHYERNQE